MKKTIKIVLFFLLAVLLLTCALSQLAWTPPALGTEGDTRQGEIQVPDSADITQVPPPHSFEEDPIPSIEPISPIGTDPLRCIQVQRCDSSGKCHWEQECR